MSEKLISSHVKTSTQERSQKGTTTMFTSYDIHRCGVFVDVGGNEYCRALKPDEELDDLEEEGVSEVVWTLYGRENGLAHSISDCATKGDAIALYQRITGQEIPCTDGNTPLRHLPPSPAITELRECVTSLSLTADNIDTEMNRTTDIHAPNRWEGVPEKLRERVDSARKVLRDIDTGDSP